MKYPDKIKHAELVADLFSKGKSVDSIKVSLSKKGLTNINIDDVLKSSINILTETFGELIETKLLNYESVINSTELQKIDNFILNEMIENSKNKLAINERLKVEELLINNFNSEEIIKQVNSDIYSDNQVTTQINFFRKKQKEELKTKNLNIYGGIFLIAISLFTVLNGSGKGPLYLIGIAGIILLYRGIKNK